MPDLSGSAGLLRESAGRAVSSEDEADVVASVDVLVVAAHVEECCEMKLEILV